MSDVQSDISDITCCQGSPPGGPVLHMELCKKLSKLSHLIQGVGLVDLEEGQLRYSKFTENRHRWNKDDYDHDGFRAEYCRRLFVTRAGIVTNVLLHCEKNMCLPGLLFDPAGKPRSLKIASFGCGPAGELAGLETYFEDLKKRLIERLISDRKLKDDMYSSLMTKVQSARLETVTGYDSSKGWREYLESLGYTFVHQHIDHEFVKEMEPVDILITSYFVHNARLFKHAAGMRTLDILQRKTKMILFIDTSGISPKVLDMLHTRGFLRVPDVKDDKDHDVIVRIWCSRD